MRPVMSSPGSHSEKQFFISQRPIYGLWSLKNRPPRVFPWWTTSDHSEVGGFELPPDARCATGSRNTVLLGWCWHRMTEVRKVMRGSTMLITISTLQFLNFIARCAPDLLLSRESYCIYYLELSPIFYLLFAGHFSETHSSTRGQSKTN